MLEDIDLTVLDCRGEICYLFKKSEVCRRRTRRTDLSFRDRKPWGDPCPHASGWFFHEHGLLIYQSPAC